MKPQDPPTSPAMGYTFERVVETALTSHVQYKQTHLHAFDVGIRAPELLRYAFGKLDENERREFTELLARSPWAMQRVVAIVKAKRTNSPPRFLFYDSGGQDELEALKILDQF